MKYLLLLFSLFVFWLAWCTHIQEQQTPNAEQLFSSIPVESWHAQFLENELFSWTYLGWIYTPIFISGNALIISWVFFIDIPKEIVHKVYSSQYTPINKSYYERIGFINKDDNKIFNVNIFKLIRPKTTYSDKDLCKEEYMDITLSNTEKIKETQWKKIYIYYATLMSTGPDVEPFEIIDTHFCFVDSGMLYKFSASNYTHEYMNQIINSLTFLN